jgi:hypothetical protein
MFTFVILGSGRGAGVFANLDAAVGVAAPVVAGAVDGLETGADVAELAE